MKGLTGTALSAGDTPEIVEGVEQREEMGEAEAYAGSRFANSHSAIQFLGNSGYDDFSLDGTTWTFNDVITMPEYTISAAKEDQDGLIMVDGRILQEISADSDAIQGSGGNPDSTFSVLFYMPGIWFDQKNRTIKFRQGVDNAEFVPSRDEFILWLHMNATQKNTDDERDGYMPKLMIDDIVNVVVTTAAAAAPRNGFNVGMIIGRTAVAGLSANKRTVVVNNLAGVLENGYTVDSPEYKAATLYFAQTPRPQKLVVALCPEKSANTPETWLEAIMAARAENMDWYSVYVASETTLTIAEAHAIAAYIETLRAAFFFDSDDENGPKDTTADVFSDLKAGQFTRTFGLYSTTKYAGAAVMGFAMGANTGVADSAYTLAYKTLAGVTPDDLSADGVLQLQKKNANYYIVRGSDYYLLEKGCCASGKWFDELIGIDQLAYNIQMACMDLLANTSTKIPYTDAGAAKFVLACNSACQVALRQGFLASGIWKGEPCLNLETGAALTSGYMCQAEPVADQPDSDKSLRICPPIYVCAIMAGAIHSVTIKVDLV